ncbi:MAG: 2'-5' RNA ligase family protein [Clostridia bacterium]|nr:2'-5' RNA ligase family protein [Clostridia bacterium]
MAESFLTIMAEYSEADQQRIGLWYDALQHAGFTGRQTPGLRHHISLASYPPEREAEAIEVIRRAGERFAPVDVAIRHIGVLPGGQTLVAAPDMSQPLTALQQACGDGMVHGFPWLPHTTLLIDETETIAAALPTLMKRFTPILAKIDRLRLCAFWPTREIACVELTGKE